MTAMPCPDATRRSIVENELHELTFSNSTPASQNQLIACEPFEDGCESVQIGHALNKPNKLAPGSDRERSWRR
jgi:hypothetical protein